MLRSTRRSSLAVTSGEAMAVIPTATAITAAAVPSRRRVAARAVAPSVSSRLTETLRVSLRRSTSRRKVAQAIATTVSEMPRSTVRKPALVLKAMPVTNSTSTESSGQ
ncbi:hypothetical protein BJQ90_01775 [Arthrobacter sp. SO3]|nr:hypothetical protein [Arthrobacter sp. SO3]